MATFLQYIQDVLAIFAEKDESLAGLPIPLSDVTIASTTTLTSASLARGTQQSTRYDGRRGEIVETSHADINKVWAVDNGGLAGSTITLSPAISASSGSNIDVLLYALGLSPDTVRRALNEVIRNTDVLHLWFPSLVNDSEFANNAQATDWPEISGSTLSAVAFVTTAAHILLGERALHLTADAADEGAHSLTFRVTEDEQLLFSVMARIEAGTWDIELYRETATAAVVKSVTIDEEDFTEVRFVETVPAGCEEMRVRFTSNAASDDIYISQPVLVQSLWQRTYVAPSWLTEPDRQIERAMVLRQGAASEATDAYVALSREFERWPLPDFLRSDRFAIPNRIQFAGTSKGPIALLCHRTFGELSADTDTAGLDRQYVAHAAAANLARTARNPDWRTIAATSGPIARRVAHAREYGKQRLVVEERQALV